jgi:hypothetical protein
LRLRRRLRSSASAAAARLFAGIVVNSARIAVKMAGNEFVIDRGGSRAFWQHVRDAVALVPGDD